MGIQEAKIEKYLHSEIKKLGGMTYKWVSPGNNGVPDRIVLLHGHVWFVEIKTLSGVVSAVQMRRIEEIRDKGCKACIVHGTSGVNNFIERIKC